MNLLPNYTVPKQATLRETIEAVLDNNLDLHDDTFSRTYAPSFDFSELHELLQNIVKEGQLVQALEGGDFVGRYRRAS